MPKTTKCRIIELEQKVAELTTVLVELKATVAAALLTGIGESVKHVAVRGDPDRFVRDFDAQEKNLAAKFTQKLLQEK